MYVPSINAVRGVCCRDAKLTCETKLSPAISRRSHASSFNTNTKPHQHNKATLHQNPNPDTTQPSKENQTRQPNSVFTHKLHHNQVHQPPPSHQQENGQPPQNPPLQRLLNLHKPATRPRPTRPNHPRAALQRRHRAHPNRPAPALGRGGMERELARVRHGAVPLGGVRDLLRGDGEGEGAGEVGGKGRGG